MAEIDETQAVDAPQEATAEAAPEPEAAPVPEPGIPKERFNQVYSTAKQLEREVEFLKQQLAKQPAAPLAAPAASAPEDPVEALIRKSVTPLMAPLREEMVNTRRMIEAAQDTVAAADFWNRPDVAPFADVKAEVEQYAKQARAQGIAVDRDLLLNVVQGQRVREQHSAQTAAAAQTVKHVAKANSTARTETGATSSGRAAPKSFDDMTVEEIEAMYGKTPISPNRR